MVLASVLGRAIGMIGTLVLTRFIAPSVVGEVSVALIVVQTASWVTTWGFGPYAVVRGSGPDAAEATFHAFFAYAALGVLVLVPLVVAAPWVTAQLSAPEAAAFVPGMALVVYIKRLGAIPERVLTRAFRFRPVALANTAGEFIFVMATLGLAVAGLGGMAVVFGNIVQAALTVALIWRAAGSKWLQVSRLSRARIADMLRFGLPLGVQSLAHNGARYWDNLLIARLFGTHPTGLYNMAYNLADIPAIHVGEQLAGVLLPSMAKLPPSERPRALEQSAALLSFLIFPMAIGFALVARPLIHLALPPAWWDVAPLLTILCTLSIFRPIPWVLSAYMEAQERTGRLMLLEVGKVVLLLGLMVALSPLGLHWVAGAVGIAYGLHAVIGVVLVANEGPSISKLARGFAEPALACAWMAACVLGFQYALGAAPDWIILLGSIIVGAAAYVSGAWIMCRQTSRALVAQVRRIAAERRQRATAM